jgi:glutamate carboxypeptidase
MNEISVNIVVSGESTEWFLSDFNASPWTYSFDRTINRVVGWLDDRLRSLGFAVERFQQERAGDDLLASRTGSGSGHLMLLGHSDTVFPHGTVSQRPMTYQGDRILGPGVCDMKSGLAGSMP